MKRDVGNLLQKLIREQGHPQTEESSLSGTKTDLTTLGVPLIRKEEGHSVIDLTHIHVFRNLHTFTRLLVSEVLDQCGFGTADIMVRRRVDPNLTPELAQAGLDWVMIYARLDTAESFPFYQRHFGNCMQVIFRTLQTKQWGGILFREFFGTAQGKSEGTPPALLFPFHLQDQNSESGNYFLVEYSRSGRFLRITVEDAIASRLQLKHIPHRVVDQNVRQSYLPSVFLIAEQIHQGILRECMNNRSEYVEVPEHRQDLFEHLRKGGLPALQTLHFFWPTDDIQMLLLEQRETADRESHSLEMLIKEIQLLEDPLVLERLGRGDTIEMMSGNYRVYFDLSRYGACLNISFDVQRQVRTLEDYLNRMPVLASAVPQRKDAMKGVRLFLIHHITAEVIGLLKAFEASGCEAITTFFVKYAGIVPEAYLETLMSLPPEYFRFYGLQRLESRDRLAGRFVFSRHFSPVSEMTAIDQAIFSEGHDFLGAMRLAAGHVFLQEAQRARDTGDQILLVEDGGYLAPIFNRFCLEDRTVGEVFAHFRLSAPPEEAERSCTAWMEDIFLGSVEHTKNGYDYNSAVEQEFHRLQFPVASIAISSLKRGPEARECAVAILSAVENILHRLGKLLSRRKILVLGSSGAIGRSLIRELRYRVDPSFLFGVDTAATGKEEQAIIEAPSVDDLDRDILKVVDTIIGVIGDSILKRKHLEEVLLNGQNKEIFLISGSTKTVEFKDVETVLQSLREGGESLLAGHRVNVDFNALHDLQTGVLQGHRVAVRFPEDPSRDKDLYLLAELMPINFLYYGIPREIVDEVMGQLFRVSCGLVRRQRSDERLSPHLLAVDREIDGDANRLPLKD